MNNQISLKTNLGTLYLCAEGELLTYLGWHKQAGPLSHSIDEGEVGAVLAKASVQLLQYLEGKRKSFEIPFDLNKGSDFEQRVWRELLKIPYGETISYSELALRVGRPKAARAVGGANGRNPLCLLIPCHRVINSSGALGGYVAGLETKEKLLSLESGAIKGYCPSGEGQ